MLQLLFNVSGTTYALPAHRVVGVVPRVELRPLARMPLFISGMLIHNGELVPVVDLSLLLGSTPTALKLSTRIILVELAHSHDRRVRLGLIAENVDRLREHDSLLTRSNEAGRGQSRLFTGMLKWEDELAQEIDVDRVLEDELKNELYGSILGLPS